jgi:CheY-like chemotaxis protein
MRIPSARQGDARAVSGRSSALILVVDDEKAFCEVVCEILVSYGYKAVPVYSVAEALSFLAVESPDLILTDVMMPDIDGLSLIRKLHGEQHRSAVPIIVVSARATSEDREAAMSAGAAGFLAKPFSSAALKALVNEHLR